ncbi:ATP-binding cassette domain-containing protein [Candidatus Pacearchaeota archaeon]|jgi:ABC-2 type transport system ATP-binding protein|nr:ATP-binding cassette domain-containing protein [Candidatus Pacearchaeota archaeon]
MEKEMVEVKNLTKIFRNFTAVDNISFNVDKGEIFAFLGPNGAGKSTTIKMMTTIFFPTKGKIKINNFDVEKEQKEVRKSIGVIFQDSTLDEDLTAYENLNYHAMLYKIPKKGRKKNIEELLDYVGLLNRKDEFIRNFSGGMKRSVEIARGLLHNPKLLFLDEPTLGLDVQTRAFLWNHIKKINKEKGITIFFTTHNMEEAEKIATKIAIIDHGKILTIGTSSEIKKKTDTKTLEEAFLKLTGNEIRQENADSIERMRMHRRGRR